MSTPPPPKLLFVLNRVLGWRTHADAVAGVVAARPDVEADILFLRPGPSQRLLVRGHHPAPGPGGLLRRIDPISWHRGPAGRPIRERIRAFEPDVVHFAGPWPGGAMGALSADLPYTLALDATVPGVARVLGEPRLWGARAVEREAALARGAARLYPWSDWAAGSLASDYGVSEDRIRVMPPAVPLAARAREPGAAGPLKILFAGHDFARKGGDRLLGWATDRLAGRCELHIASTDARAQVARPGVVAHGAVPDRTLREELMPQMDVLCHPTRADVSAHVVVEAAAAGLACVASAVGGVPDLVEHGRTGFLVEPDDDEGFVAALEALIASPERVDEMGTAALSRAEERFDARTVYDGLIDELAALAAERRAAAAEA